MASCTTTLFSEKNKLPCHSTLLFLTRIANVVFIKCGPNRFLKDTDDVLYMLAEEENKKETYACKERKEDQ
jgi:hypothetical protein